MSMFFNSHMIFVEADVFAAAQAAMKAHVDQRPTT